MMRSGWRNRGHPAFWAFVVHRISGVLLAVFLPLHFLALGQALRGEADLNAFLAWTRAPWLMASEIAIVFLLALHFTGGLRLLFIEMIPKGSGSENNSWLKMAVPAEGVDAIRTFVVDCVLDAGGRTCPPTIVGVGVGGTADLCVHLAKIAATRPLGSRCDDPDGARLEASLSEAVNLLGVGPQGLGGDSTAFAAHVEVAATHITMNPVAVNMQCHSARRASAIIDATGVHYGF